MRTIIVIISFRFISSFFFLEYDEERRICAKMRGTIFFYFLICFDPSSLQYENQYTAFYVGEG